ARRNRQKLYSDYGVTVLVTFKQAKKDLGVQFRNIWSTAAAAFAPVVAALAPDARRPCRLEADLAFGRAPALADTVLAATIRCAGEFDVHARTGQFSSG